MDIDKDAQEHQDVCIGVVNWFNIVFNSCPIESKYDDFTQGRGMTFPWIAVAHFKTEWKEDKNAVARNDWQDPIKYIPQHTRGMMASSSEKIWTHISSYLLPSDNY
jgi:hypothetical protein